MTMISLTLIQLFVLSIICQFQSSHIYHEIMNSKDGKKYFKFQVQFSSVETASVLANDDDTVKLPVRGFSEHFQYEHKDKIHNFEWIYYIYIKIYMASFTGELFYLLFISYLSIEINIWPEFEIVLLNNKSLKLLQQNEYAKFYEQASYGQWSS